MSTMTGSFAITGGGIAGLTAAIALQRIGINPFVFEAAPVTREIGAGIGLGANAFQALDRLGIGKEVSEVCRPLGLFTIYNERGKMLTRTDTFAKYGAAENFAVHRAELLNILLSHVNPQNIYTNKRLKNFEQQGNKIQLHFTDGTVGEFDYLIGAEGIHSPTRKQLLPGSSIRYSGYTCWRAVIDVSKLPWDQSSETWGKKGRFGIVPLNKGKMYWYACVNTSQDNEKMKRYTVEDLLRQFGEFHHPVHEILEATKNDNLIHGDIIDLKPIHRYAFGNIVLIGDAAHATTPNLGQGACQGMEDAVILAQEVKKGGDMADAFSRFEQRRLKRTHMIVQRSRMIGKIAQSENALVITMRNVALKLTPEFIKEKELKKINAIDF